MYLDTSNITVRGPVTKAEEELTLLQLEEEQVTKGYRCSLTRSDFLVYCGAFSYFKIATVPVIEESVNMSPEGCRYSARNQVFTTSDGTDRKLEMKKLF